MESLIRIWEEELRSRPIPITCSTRVCSVDGRDGLYRVSYRRREGPLESLRSRFVVNATGIVSSPHLPRNFLSQGSTLAWKHSLDVRSEDLERGRDILIVGNGVSAGEVVEKWLKVRRRDSRCRLVMRSPLRTLPNPILGLDIHYWIYLPERIPTRHLPRFVGSFREPMMSQDARRALRDGRVECLPAVNGYEESSLTLANGRSLTPDLLIFATGFRYRTRHLRNLLEYDENGLPILYSCRSTLSPGLFLLGVKAGRTLASPYLRGLARDARFVARQIASRRPHPSTV